MQIDSMLEEEAYNDFATRRLARFPNFHHSSALTYYPQHHIIELYAGVLGAPRIQMFDRVVSAVHRIARSRNVTIMLTEDPSLLYLHAFRTATVETFANETPSDLRGLRCCLHVALADVEEQLRGISKAHPALELNFDLQLLTDDDRTMVTNQLSAIYRMKQYFVKIRNCVQRRHITGVDELSDALNGPGLVVYVINEMLVVFIGGNMSTGLLINYDQWLMVTDTLACRFLTKLTCLLNDRQHLDNLPSWSIVRSVYQWGDGILEQCGMAAYAVLGEFESIVTGTFVTFETTDLLNLGDDFVTSLLQTAEETREEHGVPIYHTQNLIALLRDINSANCLSEIFGLRKHWGNPMVDAKKSGKAVQDRVTDELPINGSSLHKLLASFNRMITMDYIKQHGEWPKCEFGGPDSFPLKDAHGRGVTRIPERAEGHHHYHWALQKFHCNCTLDEYDDQLALASDKSVSYYRENMDAVYVNRLRAVNQNLRPPENRRLILELIRRNHMEILDMLKVVMTGTVPDSWLANSASMKGTEMKHEKARIFAVLTYEIRQYFAVTEEIIKNHIFRYNPHQTMTMSEVELMNTLRKVTRQMDPEGAQRNLSVMHIIDFSKWNLRMNYVNTCLVFKSMDDFLGTPGLIEMTHPLFSSMTNLVQDPFNPPPSGVHGTESETVWRFHNAGWEGQRQKGWTALTSALLSDLERITGVHSQICGQGDNQTLLSNFPIPHEYRNALDWITHDASGVKRILDNFYVTLEEECSSVGLKVKTAESCRSLNYFNYGKRLYFNGVELSMTLKRICKTITEPNNSFPTTEGLMKTMEGASFSAGLYSHPSVWPYVAGRICVVQGLLDAFADNPLIGNAGVTMLEGRGITYGTSFFATLLRIPASLGGVPQLSLPAYLFRGHPDPVCTDFVGLKLRADAGCITSRRILTIALTDKWYNTCATDRSSLILSPYSLNMNIPASTRKPLEEAVLPALRSSCRNSAIAPIFSTATDTYETDLLAVLSTMSPFQPILANDIYSRSIPGHRRQFISGLQNTTSLGRLVYETNNSPIIHQVSKLEEQQLQSWISKVLDVRSCLSVGTDWMSPHWVAVQKARELSWRTQIVGVTIPHPAEQFVLVSADHDLCSSHHRTCLPEHLLFIRHSDNLITVPGSDSRQVTTVRSSRSSPYLGSTISEGVIQKQITCVNPSASFQDSLRLNLVRLWTTREDSNLDLMLRSIISTRTDMNLHVLNLATGRPSRLSYNHRASLIATVKTCATSSTTNMSTRIYVSSNRMGRFSHGEYNYHMPFGPAFLNFQSLICLNEVLSRTPSWSNVERQVFHAHVRYEDIPVVFDGHVDITGRQLRVLTHQQIPRMMFASQHSLTFINIDGQSSGFTWSEPNSANRRCCRVAYCNQLLGDSLVRETLMRELITTDISRSYIQRDSVISIGDIRLVTVQGLVSALAMNMLLIIPYQPLLSQEAGSFMMIAYNFLDSLSAAFWAQFTQPLSASSHLTVLVAQCPSIQTFNLTSSLTGILPVLKTAITRRMWQLWTNLINVIVGETHQLDFLICAPNLLTARLLWSKFSELCVYGLFKACGLRWQRAGGYARDFAANIHSTPLSQLADSIVTIMSDFCELASHLRVNRRVVFPRVQVFSLVEPWIDRVRTFTSPVAPTLHPRVAERPVEYPSYGHRLTYQRIQGELIVPILTCQCLTYRQTCVLHTETYFMPTGHISKAHYKFLDLIYMHDLSLEGVVCLGSESGTEALAFASHRECNRVYVSNIRQVSDFPPHMIGSFIPAAFACSGLSYKLQHPSAAAVTGGNILSETSVNSMIAHLSDATYTGLTVDIDLADSDDTTQKLTLLANSIRLFRSSIVNYGWLIVKLPIKCEHEVAVVLSFLSDHFEKVSAEYSNYARPKSQLLYFVCVCVRETAATRDQLSSVYITLVDNPSMGQLLARVQQLAVPNIGLASPYIAASRSHLSSVLSSSFITACHMYLTGWGQHYTSIPTAATLMQDLRQLRNALQLRLEEMAQTFYRVYSGLPIVRNTILTLDGSPFHQQLNHICIFINRIDLLLSLLIDGSMDLGVLYEKVVVWLNDTHTYMIQTRPFTARLDVSRFLKVTSRYLFEILGHINQWKHTETPRPWIGIILHRRGDTAVSGPLGVWPRPIVLTSRQQIYDNTWRWTRRSEVMFCLASLSLIPVASMICIPHCYVLEDLMAAAPNTIQVTPNSLGGGAEGDIQMLWVPDGKSVIQLLPMLCRGLATVCCPVRDLVSVSLLIKVISVYRPAWSGVIPDRVILLCDLTLEPTPVPAHLTPSLMEFYGKFDARGVRLVGCGCVDCTTEIMLLEQFGVSPSVVDKVCSMGRIESVLETRHVG